MRNKIKKIAGFLILSTVMSVYVTALEYINNNKRFTTILVDGKKIDGNVLPQFNDNELHRVTVEM